MNDATALLELRDVSKPIAFDEQGRPRYAPRGIRLRLW